MKLVLKVVNELTIAALKLQNELRDPESSNNTHESVDILLKICKIFHINTLFKGQHLNDDISRPNIPGRTQDLTQQFKFFLDERIEERSCWSS